MKKSGILLVLLLLVSSITYAEEGMRVTLETPSVTFRSTENKPLMQGSVVEHYIRVVNKNNFTISVELKPEAGLVIEFPNNDYAELKPNTTKVFRYLITIDSPGSYSSGVYVVYSTKVYDSPTVPLMARINFVNIKKNPDYIKAMESKVVPAEIEKSNETDNKIIGGDTDDYGCLLTAGYRWCDTKQKCLRTWEEDCPGGIVEEDKNNTMEVINEMDINIVDKTSNLVRVTLLLFSVLFIYFLYIIINNKIKKGKNKNGTVVIG